MRLQKIITKRASKKYNRRMRRHAHWERVKTRWHARGDKLRARISNFFTRKRAKTLIRKLRKHYARTGEKSLCIQGYELANWDIQPALDYLALRNILTYTHNDNSTEYQINIT